MIGVGLFGSYSHQIHQLLLANPRAKLVGVAELSEPHLKILSALHFRRYHTFEELIADPDIHVVSLCSPRRKDQAGQAIAALHAGKHVYAEKPSALTEPELDAILAAAKQTNRHFHEMAGTAFLQPYLTMRRIVQAGTLGTVVQVVAQKCYPFANNRPHEEEVDGGLLLQVGVHAARMVEHVACQPITSLQAWETKLANQHPSEKSPAPGGLRTAALFSMTLQNGGLATATVNYLNPKGTGLWGYESLTIYGGKGLVESHGEGQTTRLVVGEKNFGPLDLSLPGRDYFEYFLDELTNSGPMPLTLEEELHPTRMLLRAKTHATLNTPAQ